MVPNDTYTENSETGVITFTHSVPANITEDITIYEIFKEDSVYSNILPESYLTMFESGINNVLRFNTTGLRGKITIPKSYHKQLVAGTSYNKATTYYT